MVHFAIFRNIAGKEFLEWGEVTSGILITFVINKIKRDDISTYCYCNTGL